MKYDDKVTQGFGSVLCTKELLFLGHLGPNSKISVFKFLEGYLELKFVGFLSPMVGTVRRMLLTKYDTKLICNTNCGYIYVWDVSEETVIKLESLTSNPIYMDGYIPLKSRIDPTAVFEPKNSAECTDIDILHNDVIVGVEKWPELNVNFYNYKTGEKFYTASNLVKPNVDKNKFVLTMKVDTNLVTERDEIKGQWVVFGSDFGSFHVVFVPTLDPDNFNQKNNNLEIKAYSFKLVENEHVNTLAWPVRNKNTNNLKVLCGCSDGTLRYVILNIEEDGVKLGKKAVYQYSKAAMSATVNKIVCATDTKTGVPFTVGSCNMIGELGNFDFGDLTTNCVFEGIYQKLMKDTSDDIVSFAKVQDFITDVSLSPDNKFVVLVSCNDSVYLCLENLNDNDKSPWKKPVKLNWKTQEFLKFVNN